MTGASVLFRASAVVQEPLNPTKLGLGYGPCRALRKSRVYQHSSSPQFLHSALPSQAGLQLLEIH